MARNQIQGNKNKSVYHELLSDQNGIFNPQPNLESRCVKKE